MTDDTAGPRDAGMSRSLTWFDGFSIALGVPVLVVMSVGSIVVLTGTLSPLIWLISVTVGMLQSFIWAEMASHFPQKSGGHSLYGSEAWRRYNRFIPPLDIWGNWFAWSPVLAISGLLIGGYVQRLWLPWMDWQLGWGPFSISIATVIGAGVLLMIFWANHFVIKFSARLQLILGIFSLIPIAVLIIAALVLGKVDLDNLTPFTPVGASWLSWETVKQFAAGLFVAAWSAYAFETTVCYTAEFRNPAKDAPKAILTAGAVNLIFYILFPFVLLGVVGVATVAKDPATALAPLAEIVFGPFSWVLIILLIIALVLIMNTAMLGSARTIYQAAADGYTLKAFHHLTKRRIPGRGMGFDVGVNLLLMLLGTPIYILAASTVGYMVTNIIDLTGGWLLRRDAGKLRGPYRTPKLFIHLALVMAALNFVLLFLGGPSWGWGAMGLGWAIVLFSIPIYLYRRWTDRRTMTTSPATGVLQERSENV